MAAVVQIHEMSAASVGVDKTSGTVRFKAADNSTVDTNDRLQIPGAGRSNWTAYRDRAQRRPSKNADVGSWHSSPGQLTAEMMTVIVIVA